MNSAQLEIRVVSNHNADDCAGEQGLCERLHGVVLNIQLALGDNVVTTTEALGLLDEARAAAGEADLSLARTQAIQGEIDAVYAMVGQLPTDAIARLPRLPRLTDEQPLFAADATWDADMRRRYPHLGLLTVGQALRQGDYGEAA
ncbi:MAG: hypothetical protein ACYC5O_00710 [Anaerolineae bacterium]